MSMRGGGTAGGGKSGRGGKGPEVVRHVPKFLKQFEHLLPSKGGPGGYDEDDVEGAAIAEAEAAQRQVERDTREDSPDGFDGATVVEEEDGLQGELQALADEEKEKGNAAYAQGKFDAAIDHFSKAIACCQGNHLLFSNRSAAHAGKKDFKAALNDARKVIYLAPKWAKGYSRLGAAYLGLKQPVEAEAAYKRGLKEEPKNQALKEGLQQAQEKQRQVEEEEARSGKHVFKRKGAPAAASPAAVSEDSSSKTKKAKEGPSKGSRLLSFSEDAEDA